MRKFTLREVCERAGVTRRAVQGYECAGLVAAIGKNKFGHLLYDEHTVAKVAEIRFLQEIGLSVKEIAAFADADKAARLAILETKHDELGQRAAHMSRLMADLEKLIDELK